MPKEVDYKNLMEFLGSNNICCSINTAVKVFGHNACWDCFRRMRVDIVEIGMTWDIDTIARFVEWRIE